MPVCRNFLKTGECKDIGCLFKHDEDEIRECNMYKLGFCIYGPTCRYKHKKVPGGRVPPRMGRTSLDAGNGLRFADDERPIYHMREFYFLGQMSYSIPYGNDRPTPRLPPVRTQALPRTPPPWRPQSPGSSATSTGWSTASTPV